jgi:hypothetical protein
MTKEGAPYYYNDHTGESRWEHPSDMDYMALFQEVKRRKMSGEYIDVHLLQQQIQQGHAYAKAQTTLASEEEPNSDSWSNEPSAGLPSASFDSVQNVPVVSPRDAAFEHEYRFDGVESDLRHVKVGDVSRLSYGLYWSNVDA